MVRSVVSDQFLPVAQRNSLDAAAHAAAPDLIGLQEGISHGQSLHLHPDQQGGCWQFTGDHRQIKGHGNDGANGQRFRCQGRVRDANGFDAGIEPLGKSIEGIARRDPMQGIAYDIGIQGAPGEFARDPIRG